MKNMKCGEVGRSRVWRGYVCGMIRVGGQRIKGSEWWNEELGRAVSEKRRAFEE